MNRSDPWLWDSKERQSRVISFFTWKKWDLKRDPNKISIPYRRINVKLICSLHAQICVLYKYRLYILYSIRRWNIWKLVISYRHKEVTPKHRWNLLRQTLKQPEALNANQQRPMKSKRNIEQKLSTEREKISRAKTEWIKTGAESEEPKKDDIRKWRGVQSVEREVNQRC